VLVGLAGQPAAGPSKSANSSRQQAELRIKAIHEAADAYKLYVGREPRQELARSPRPVLRFDDAVTLSVQGLVYLWTDGTQRPLAIASFFYRADGARVDEFQSLATGGELAAQFEGTVVWHPKTPGIELKPLEDRDEVPAAKELRLSAMRNIARRFSASVTDTTSGRQELRMLTQPLHRYQDPGTGLVDGAIFAFAKGTNPEVLLVLEAQSQDGRAQWHFGLARMSERECFAQYSHRDIWAVARRPSPQTADEAYFNRVAR
jgi:hypothetical protein